MIIMFSSAIGPVPVDVILKEKHNSKVSVTKIAIETGAKVTDHAHVEPKEYQIDFAAANAAEVWNALVQFQESRTPFTAVSGLYVYNNMVITELEAERSNKTARVLKGTATLQEVIFAETQYSESSGDSKGGDKNKSKDVSKDKAAAGSKDKASGTVARGDSPAKTVTPVNQSIINRVFGSSPTPSAGGAAP